MKEENLATLIAVIIVIFFISILFFIGLRFYITNPTVYYSHVCELEFGENWIYEYTNNFGPTCVKLDYVTLEKLNRTKYPFESVSEVHEKYCNLPSFWDLKEWYSNCDVRFTGEGRS